MRSLYAAPAYYAMMFGDRASDVAFYRAVASRAPAGPVLEYGVGDGRVALPLARDGREVLGVDTAPEMLDGLARRLDAEPDDVRARVAARLADAREASLGRTFALVTCPFNGLAHHATRAELAAFFARVREHLAPGGLFAFDIWLPNARLLAGASTDSPRIRDPRDGRVVRCTERYEYEPFTQVLTATLTVVPVDDEPEVLALTLRQFFPEETLTLLAHHGLEVVWRTSRFAPPPQDVGAPGAPWDALATEPDEFRGEMLAYVCRPL